MKRPNKSKLKQIALHFDVKLLTLTKIGLFTHSPHSNPEPKTEPEIHGYEAKNMTEIYSGKDRYKTSPKGADKNHIFIKLM